MHNSRTPISLALVTLLMVGLAAHSQELPIRMMVWSWTPECQCSAAMSDDAIDRVVNEFAEMTGIPVEVDRQPVEQYRDVLMNGFDDEQPADIVWVTAVSVAGLVEGEAVIALDEALVEMPWLVADLSDEALANLSVEGNLYAIPLGPEPDLVSTGYAITRSAVEMGRMHEALELVSLIREQVPRRGEADLVVSDLVLAAEGGELHVTAEVKNIGQQPADNVMVQILVDDELVIGEFVVDGLEAGASHRVEVLAGLPDDGPHGFAAVIDPNGEIAENNELNNLTHYGTWAAAGGSGAPSPPAAIGSAFVLDTNAFRTKTGNGSPRPTVRVAFGGSNYLVVWTQQIKPYKNEFNHRLVGARVSPSGVLLDTTPFVITTSAGKYDSFNVSFGAGKYVVVWERDLGWKEYASNQPLPNPYSVIQAARVSTSGVVLDSTPINIENAPCSQCPANYTVSRYDAPDVAFTGTDFLVVYRSAIFGHAQYWESIDARLLTASGSVRPGTTALMTSPQGSQFAVHGMQSLAFSPAKKEGFLLFNGTDFATTPYTVKEAGVWIKVNGTTVTATTMKTITSMPRSPLWKRHDYSAVAADGSGGYLGAFETTSGCPNMYCTNLGAAALGAYSGQQTWYLGTLVKGREERPDVAFDGSNYTAVHVHAVGCTSYLGAVRVSKVGVPSQPVHLPSPTGFNDVSIAFGATSGLAVFTRYHYNNVNPSATYYSVHAVRATKS